MAKKAGKAALVDRLGNRFPRHLIDLDNLTQITDDGYLDPSDLSSYRKSGALWFDLSRIAAGEDAANQKSTVERSNFRTLIREYGSCGEPTENGGHAFLPMSYTNVDTLGILARDLTKDIVDTLIRLVDVYCVYDEDDLSALEFKEIDAAWDQYMRADVSSAIQDIDPGAWDVWTEMPKDMQESIFWDVQSDHDYYPEHGGIEIHWETDDIAGWIVERIGPWARVVGNPGVCIAAGTETLF